MTTPRGTYGGGYYASSAFPDTPIYDSLVAERGTPQIAPIRVPAQYDTPSNLPALPAALPALPAGPSASYQQPQYGGGYNGYPAPPQQQAYQPQPAPTAYIPQQAGPQRGYPGPAPQPQQPYQGGTSTGYEAVRPVPPRPVPPRQPAPQPYGDDPYRRPYNGQGY